MMDAETQAVIKQAWNVVGGHRLSAPEGELNPAILKLEGLLSRNFNSARCPELFQAHAKAHPPEHNHDARCAMKGHTVTDGVVVLLATCPDDGAVLLDAKWFVPPPVPPPDVPAILADLRESGVQPTRPVPPPPPPPPNETTTGPTPDKARAKWTMPDADMTCSKCGRWPIRGCCRETLEPAVHEALNRLFDDVATPQPTILQLEKGDVCVLMAPASVAPPDLIHHLKWWEEHFPGVEIRVMPAPVQVLRPAKGGEDDANG